jgi:hypothetical protein
MNKEELNFNLKTFKQVCQDKGYIIGQLYFDKPNSTKILPSFIVKMMGRKVWLDAMGSRDKALDVLIDVLWETTTPQIRESVYILNLYNEDEAHLLKQSNSQLTH